MLIRNQIVSYTHSSKTNLLETDADFCFGGRTRFLTAVVTTLSFETLLSESESTDELMTLYSPSVKFCVYFLAFPPAIHVEQLLSIYTHTLS